MTEPKMKMRGTRCSNDGGCFGRRVSQQLAIFSTHVLRFFPGEFSVIHRSITVQFWQQRIFAGCFPPAQWEWEDPPQPGKVPVKGRRTKECRRLKSSSIALLVSTVYLRLDRIQILALMASAASVITAHQVQLGKSGR